MRPLAEACLVLMLLAAGTTCAAAGGLVARTSLSDEIASMDVAVIALLLAAPGQTDDSSALSQFKIAVILKGDLPKEGSVIQTLHVGSKDAEAPFLLTGVQEGDSNVVWAPPVELSHAAVGYLAGLAQLPSKGLRRWAFLQRYLEHSDPVLANDAFVEFTSATGEDLQGLRHLMPHDDLLAWVCDEDLDAERKRLYFRMLGECGLDSDLPALERLMNDHRRKQPRAMDALIACYLSIRGERGLQLIEDLYLKNAQAEFHNTHAAIAALRFHADQRDEIPQRRIVESMRHMLQRPNLADLVIYDLARWNDWGSLDELVDLFKQAKPEASWVRTPVAAFLLSCPLPSAKDKVAELSAIDPQSFEDARAKFDKADVVKTADEQSD